MNLSTKRCVDTYANKQGAEVSILDDAGGMDTHELSSDDEVYLLTPTTKAIINNIQQYIEKTSSKITPEYFQLGTLGAGLAPNYQVRFTNGSVQTFRFNGTPHHRKEFNSSNLCTPIIWKDVKPTL